MERVDSFSLPVLVTIITDITGVTPGGGALQLLRLIRVLRLIRGTGMHRIRHEARIHHANVAKAADVRVAAPRLGVVAPWPRETGAGHTRATIRPTPWAWTCYPADGGAASQSAKMSPAES
jgi:hypothetical protein